MHNAFQENIAADLGFTILANGDFKVARSRGVQCKAGCGFVRDANDDVTTSRDTTPGPRNLFLINSDGDYVARRT